MPTERSKKYPGDLNIISLGAGVQSSMMALAFSRGEFEVKPGGSGKIDFAIFADTQNEGDGTYKWLDYLEKQLTFPGIRVTWGNLQEDVENYIDNGVYKRGASIPFFLVGLDGKKGLANRRCTSTYKIEQIEQGIRREYGLKKGQRWPKGMVVNQYLGISYDEIFRMKTFEKASYRFHYPLVEKKITRMDCFKWMEERQYPKPAKSACVYCPYHDNKFWKEMRDERPKEWKQCVDFDKKVRNAGPALGLSRAKELYIHSQRIPLDQVDLDKGSDQPDLFGDMADECEGMCGV